LIDNRVTGAGDTPDHLSLYARFDDLPAAAASKDMFESALTTVTVTFEFVDHHEYFALDHTHARAQNISADDGQVEFIATPKTMMDVNLEAIFAAVREFAEQFALVRSFAYIETKGSQLGAPPLPSHPSITKSHSNQPHLCLRQALIKAGLQAKLEMVSFVLASPTRAPDC
jgi:hypothetical protein